MGSVYVRIGHQDDLMITQSAQVKTTTSLRFFILVPRRPNPGTHGRDDRPNFIIV